MRLNKIKLAGFKSFVDPTTVNLPSNLVAVVGPNGCGKSNIIDAVRWVLGESSAKNLRGESMADVIFSGSSARKPVGTASIELVFDNSDGAIGGQYASFAEISIRRVVSRDGSSDYFLNNTRCRRKDITHILLGTGLGPRSYSIIEQGTISRVVEARPEELRSFLEEAAGISKYKDRRRDTEHRMRHTRENLDRLNDLRDEVDKQIRSLQRQARTAERYKELKQEERQLSAQLLALRLQALDAEIHQTDERRQSGEAAWQAAQAEQREAESALESTRAQQVELTDAFNEVQGRYYTESSQLARLEQSIQHGQEMRHRQQADLSQVQQSRADLERQTERDEADIQELESLLSTLAPELDDANTEQEDSRGALAQAEQRRRQWQENWDGFHTRASRSQQTAQVERTRIEQLERQLQGLLERRRRVREELDGISLDELQHEIQEFDAGIDARRDERDQARERVVLVEEEIRQLREQDKSLSAELDRLRNELQQMRGRLASVEALQQAALGKTDAKRVAWLEQRGLRDNPRLAQLLRVEPGWERAVETVLGDDLQAIRVAGLEPLAESAGGLEGASLSLFESGRQSAQVGQAGTLAARVYSEYDVSSWLDGVLTAANLEEAVRLRATLSQGQSVITPDGLWLGRDWLRISRAADSGAGVIAREQEIRALHDGIAVHAERASALEQQHDDARRRLAELEGERTQSQQALSGAAEALASLQARRDGAQSRLEQVRSRLQRLQAEHEELEQESSETEEKLAEARIGLETALAEIQELEQERQNLAEARQECDAELARGRERHENARRRSQEAAIRLESRRSAYDSATLGLQRMRTQLEQLAEREEALRIQLESGDEPLAQQKIELEGLRARRTQIESALSEARRRLEDVEQELQRLSRRRHEAEQRVGQLREGVDEIRLRERELAVRHENLLEQFAAVGLALEEVVESLPEDAQVSVWDENLAALSERIGRLGPINLASIDELKEQSQRKEYLDTQHADVSEALSTLENAIRKIDRETRTRFKETYDRVNTGLGVLYPRLFGGGHAYLELTGEDLLESGVTIMARPPGKRNSSIHLLSGGEKAMTAVALVFAIFQLNPAPFCMLDEVDAPLDDANVGRFCDIVREMSEKVQFVFITHNKNTIQLADHLAGITMNEPGVSRLVTVDVNAAVKLAAM